jgi:hypothetical protein
MTCAATTVDMLACHSRVNKPPLTTQPKHQATTHKHITKVAHVISRFSSLLLSILVALEMPHYSFENVWGRSEYLIFQRLVGSSQLPMNPGPQRAA